MPCDKRDTALFDLMESIMSITPETETKRLLATAQTIARDVLGDASEAAVLAVFHRLCAETDMAGPSFDDDRIARTH